MERDDESAEARPDGGEPRRARTEAGREWELFVREETTGPLRHVGSVSARTAGVAREQAESLFGWTAESMWLCPADEVRRVGGRSLDGAEYASDGDDAENGTAGDGDATEGDDAEASSVGNQTASGDAAETEVSG